MQAYIYFYEYMLLWYTFMYNFTCKKYLNKELLSKTYFTASSIKIFDDL